MGPQCCFGQFRFAARRGMCRGFNMILRLWRCDPYCVDGYCRSGDARERTSVFLVDVVRESARKCMGILLPMGIVYWIRMRGPTSRIGWINKELCNEQDVPIVFISKMRKESEFYSKEGNVKGLRYIVICLLFLFKNK